MKPADALLALAGQVSVLSLLAFGGVNAVVPELRRLAVDSHHWMTDADFSALFAISQAAPGPNMMISTMVGWKAAGLPGALAATLAMCLPSCLLTYAAAGAWERYRESAWRRRLAAALAPMTVGLVFAAGWLLVRAADRDVRLAAVTAATAAVVYFTRSNPLWPLAAAAGLGLLGWV